MIKDFYWPLCGETKILKRRKLPPSTNFVFFYLCILPAKKNHNLTEISRWWWTRRTWSWRWRKKDNEIHNHRHIDNVVCKSTISRRHLRSTSSQLSPVAADIRKKSKEFEWKREVLSQTEWLWVSFESSY